MFSDLAEYFYREDEIPIKPKSYIIFTDILGGYSTDNTRVQLLSLVSLFLWLALNVQCTYSMCTCT